MVEKLLRQVRDLLRGKCLRCGKQEGDDARYGKIVSVQDGRCDQCDTWGES